MAHPMVFCDICNIGVSSEVTMHDHVKGRRHQQALGAMERRKAQARNSLYCHGFPPSTPPAALHAYFLTFGPVSRVMVETQRGCYCIVQFESEEPVQRALHQRNHQLFEHTLTVRPRKPITTYRRTPDADRNVRKVKASKEEGEQVESSHEQLMKSLLQSDSVLGQMEMLYETMRLSDDELELRKSVCDYLHAILSPFLPTSTIHQFGSSVNGFGMRGCDMDIFLDLHDSEVSLQWEETLRQKLKPVNLPYIREIQVLKTTEGPLMPSQLRQLSLIHRVKLVSRILKQHASLCIGVQFVPSVRCPIVTFVHSPTGIKCDLSINNRLALRNTKLLTMCAEERRVRLLVFAVRYWGRWKQVAGNQNCGPRLSNYCLSLLVLFYLMNTSPLVLPSVQSLAELVGPKECVVEEWDCSLPDAVPPSSNTQPADELLAGFFQFFSQLSLSSSVILTRPGTVMPLNDFLMEKINTPGLADFKVKAMAVQDPFVLHHNIAQNINNALRDQLVLELSNAAAKTSTWVSREPASTDDGSTSQTSTSSTQTATASRHPSLGTWGLPYLFSNQGCQKPTASASSTSPVSTSSSWCEVPAGIDVKKTSQWTCPLTLNLSVLSQEVLTALRAKGDYRVAWYQRVETLLVWVLRDIFLFKVTGDQIKTEQGQPEEGVEEMCVDHSSDAEHAATKDAGSLDATKHDLASNSSACSTKKSKKDPVPPLTLVSGQQKGAGELTKAEGAGTSVKWGKSLSFTGDDCSVRQHSPSRQLRSRPRRSSADAQLSPMVISSPLPSSPVSSEQGKLLPGVSAVLQQEVALGEKSPSAATMKPCSQINYSAEGSPVDIASSGEWRPGFEDVADHSSDVEMTLDPKPDASHPTTSTMDSPAVPEGSRDLPHKCSMGEVACRTSPIPPRVECSPVGDGEVLNCVKDNQLESEVDGTPVSKPGSSLESSSSIDSGQPVDHSSTDNKASKSTSATTTSADSKHATQAKKCQPLRVSCEGKVKAWYGRKVTRANLLAEGHADDLELEKLISEKLAARDAGCSLPNLHFDCTLCPVPKADQALAEIWFEPQEPVAKEFSVFITFFKSFFTKLMSKNLVGNANI